MENIRKEIAGYNDNNVTRIQDANSRRLTHSQLNQWRNMPLITYTPSNRL